MAERLSAQTAAVRSGDPAAVERASEQLIALALRDVAALRTATGKWTEAIELYTESLQLEDAPTTRLELAAASMSAGQTERAANEADKVLSKDPKNASALQVKAQTLIARNDYAAAVDALRRSLDLHRDVNTQYALAASLLQLKEKERAQAVFREMLEEYGNKAIWHEVFGGAYREAKYLDDAVREFKLAAEMDPSLPHVHAFLGEVLLEQAYWAPNPEIVKEFTEEARQYPKGYFGHYYLGVLYSQEDQLAEANQHLQAATEADPQNPDPWLYLGLNQFKSQDYSGAQVSLLKAVELTGDDQSRANYQIRRAYIALGRILSSQGEKDKAEVYLKKAKELSGKSLEVSSSVIASEMEQSGKGNAPAVIPSKTLPKQDLPGQTAAPQLDAAHKKAIAEREKYLAGILATSYNDWGTSEARQKDYASALSHFHAAAKWDDSIPGLMRNMGLAALRLSDEQEAIRALGIAVEQDPHDQLAAAMLGMTLFSQHQFPEAAKAFNRAGDALYRDPRMAYAWAFSLAHSDDLTKAVDVLNHLQQQTMPPDMLVGIGDLYTQTGDYQDGLKAFQKALTEDPSTPHAHYYAGESLIKLDRPNEAIPEFEAELQLTPDDPNVQYHLAFAMLQASHKDEAVALLQKIVAAHPDHAQAQYQLGKAYLDEEQNQPAIEHLEAAARLDPGKDYIHYQLQAAYRKAGRTADADSELKVYREMKAAKRETSTPQSKGTAEQ